jgi:hypothetical protein
VGEDVANGGAVGDEGDDPRRGAIVGAHAREDLVHAGGEGGAAASAVTAAHWGELGAEMARRA